MRCAEWDEGTLLIAELDIMLVGLRTAELGGLSSSLRIDQFEYPPQKKVQNKKKFIIYQLKLFSTSDDDMPDSAG
jgi:hypothetical protein